jgi:hypothetical protein
VLVGIVIGFIAGGSPATERKRGFDETRAQDLSSLANCISQYANDNKSLPENLETLSLSTQYSYCSNRTDPETGTAYDYRILPTTTKTGVTQGTFELCANFTLESTANSNQNNGNYYVVDKWHVHKAGQSCDTEVVTLGRNDGLSPVPTSPAAVPVAAPVK